MARPVRHPIPEGRFECDVEGCPRIARKGRRKCAAHSSTRRCPVKDCGHLTGGRRLCPMHHKRELRGAPMLAPPHDIGALSRQPMLPAEPLLAAIEARGGVVALMDRNLGWLNHKRREAFSKAVDRARLRGYVLVEVADDLCIRLLACHPMEVYGDLWLGEPDEETGFLQPPGELVAA